MVDAELVFEIGVVSKPHELGYTAGLALNIHHPGLALNVAAGVLCTLVHAHIFVGNGG